MMMGRDDEPSARLRRADAVIYLAERNLVMLKKDLIFRNPLRTIGGEADNMPPAGGFGAVSARAGVGKTALMVQLALDSLLRGRNVLHISLSDPVKKVCLWYEEVFRNIARLYDIGQMEPLWETILPHRLIMAFHAEGFSAERLEERLVELTEQDIFLPRMILVDGLPFGEGVRPTLEAFQALARSYELPVWFTVKTHRHQPPGPDGLPVPLKDVSDLFHVAFELQPVGKEIEIRPLIGLGAEKVGETTLPVILDPATMLIKDHTAAA